MFKNNNYEIKVKIQQSKNLVLYLPLKEMESGAKQKINNVLITC